MSDLIFIDRDRECKTLNMVLEEVKKGKGKTVVISGEAGIGKTELVEWLLDKAKENDFKCFQGSCISRDALSYHPFNEAFEVLNTPDTSVSSLPLGISIFSGQENTDSISIFDVEKPNTLKESFDNIAKMADGCPLIIIIEELHWGDKATLLAFRYISEHVPNHPILLLGTYRPGESMGYIVLDETIHHLKQRNLCKHIELKPFDLNKTKKIIEELLDVEPSDNFCKMIHSKTQGNPLFIVETVKSMLGKGLIIPEESIYPPMDDSFEWPSTVKYVIERKIVKLDKKTRNLLQSASILGYKFNYELLSNFAGMDEMEILDYLDTALEHGILEEMDEEEGYCFKNLPVRDILYESLFKGKKRLLNRRAAETIEKLYSDSLHLYRDKLARYYEKAKLYDKAFDNYVKAAELEEDENEKISYYRSALELPKLESKSVKEKEIKKYLGIYLLEYGSDMMKDGGSSYETYLEEALDIFDEIEEQELYQKCFDLLKDDVS